jgi:hypothetical protein
MVSGSVLKAGKMKSLVICMVVALPAGALAERHYQGDQSFTHDCSKDPEAVVDVGRGTFTFTGTCDRIAITGGENKVTIENVKELALTGGSNTIAIGGVDKIRRRQLDHVQEADRCEEAIGVGDRREQQDRPGEVNLWRQHLGRVPDEVFADPAIATLILADNDLAEVPARLGELRALRVLDLGHNQLGGLPDVLDALAALEFLYVHDNRLAALPRLPARLRYLNVSDNQLSELRLDGFAELVELRASGNPLRDLRVAAPKLRELHLRGCPIEMLPALGRELRVIDARDCKLAALPAAIGELAELRALDLRGNPLATLPDELAALPKLEKLDLRWIPALRAPAWLGKLEARGCLIYR